MNTTAVSPERVHELIRQAEGPPSNSRTLARLMLLGIKIEADKQDRQQ